MALKIRKNKVNVPVVVPKRRGAEQCPLNRCMELISGAWAPHVVWYLSAQPRRFSELRIDIPAISARVLSQRLRELEAKGVVTRTVVPTTPPSVEYALTELGSLLVPALAAIAEVGLKLGTAPPRPRMARGHTARAPLPR
jgi:DNA-binding HxlR family transcriptional regulator